MGDLSAGSPLTRRRFLIRLGGALGAASLPLVAACSQPAAPAGPAESKPAEAKPTEAAGPAAQQAPAAAKPGSLNVWFNANWNKVSDEALGNIFVEWGKKNNMEVEYQVISAQGNQKIAAALQAGQPPEIMEAWISTAYWWKLGELVEVSPLYQQLKTKGGGMFPVLDKLVTLGDNKQWAIPFEIYPWPMHARRDLWEGPDGFPKTWDQFMETAVKVQQPPKTYAFAMATGHETDHFGNFHDLMKAHGAAMQDASGKPTINQPGTVQALQLVKKMWVDLKIIPPDSIGATATNWNNEAYQKGRGLAIINPPTVYGALMVTDKELLDKTGLYPLPAGPSGSFTEITFKPFVIYKKAKNAEKAMDALAYFMEPERYRTYTESVVGRSVPVYKDLTKTDFFQKDPFNNLVKIVDGGGLPRFHAGLDSAWFGALIDSNVISDMMQKVVQQNEDPAKAVEWAQGEAEKLYDQYR
jgi:multiple sugar transport system substrate-binding protein